MCPFYNEIYEFLINMGAKYHFTMLQYELKTYLLIEIVIS